MKITMIISFLLFVQVSASFLDIFQGAVHSVQNSFGKVFVDLVTDVKYKVDCAILAVENVIYWSDNATTRYYEKCRNSGNHTMTDTHQTESDIRTVDISISRNEVVQKLLPGELNARINETITNIKGYHPPDQLAEIERNLAEETERLTDVSNLVKLELDKLSTEIHIEISKAEHRNFKPSIGIILQELRLLETLEENIKNTSEANEVHSIIEKVLHKLDLIEASEVSENAKVERILKALENNTDSSYGDLKQRLENWNKEKDRQLNTIKKKMEEHERNIEHSNYLQTRKQSDKISKGKGSDDTNDLTTVKQFPLDQSGVNLASITTSSNILVPTDVFFATADRADLSDLTTFSPDKFSVPLTALNIKSTEIDITTTESKPGQSSNTEAAMPISNTPMHTQSTDNATAADKVVPILTNAPLSPSQPIIKTPNFESNAIPDKANDRDLITTISYIPATITENRDLISVTHSTEKSLLLTMGEIAVPKIENQQSITKAVEAYETATPVAITTTSYNTGFITSIKLNTVPPTSIALFNNDELITTMSYATVAEEEISKKLTSSATHSSVTPKILTDEFSTEQIDKNEYNSRETETNIESNIVDSVSIPEGYFGSTIAEKNIDLSTTPTLNVFNAYVDHVATTTITTPSATTVKSEEITIGNAKIPENHPQLKLSHVVQNDFPHYFINKNLVTPNTTHTALPPPSYARHRFPVLDQSYHSRSMVNQNSKHQQMLFNTPIPYTRHNDPMIPFNREGRRPTRPTKTISEYNENLPDSETFQ